MAISPISTAGGAATQTTGSTASSGGMNLSSGDFLKLFIAQLKNQNPLQPTSSDQFLQQTAMFSQVQGINQMSQNVSQLLSFQQMTQGADLIGKTVTYQKTGANAPLTGVVSGVNVVNGQAQLAVGSDSVTLPQVQSIRAA